LRVDVVAGPDAADVAVAGEGTGVQPQCRAPRSLCLFGIAGNFHALHKVYRAVSGIGTRCFAAGAGGAPSDGWCFSGSGCNFHCCDQSCAFHTGSYKLSLRCKSTSDERSAGNLHATFRGSRRPTSAPATRSLEEQSSGGDSNQGCWRYHKDFLLRAGGT
jgi:hypothetical protein